ncbi:hypothetical protein [Flavivirga spongiicola]|uniref:Uncharacterized protein n=1 Tax=Flavivirga spongiicola TaxID=421621 RepID=A0ABU7XXX9_9FLAO|nr:hypothetical protein [Flavivirga sp. MEBiC05379]MDO5980398.1 hypothetical protein [Flavivirga sp. MEBiC05379]
MGGYMGFGLQKWIYSRNPRKKLYVKERISSFTALPKYSRTFTIKPSIKENKILVGFLTITTVIGFAIILNSCYKHFVVYSNERSKQIAIYKTDKDNMAFNFLLNSGKNRLKQHRIVAAYSELNLAYAIRPNDKELNQLLIETLSILCSKDIAYCDALDKHLQNDY